MGFWYLCGEDALYLKCTLDQSQSACSFVFKSLYVAARLAFFAEFQTETWGHQRNFVLGGVPLLCSLLLPL